MQYKLHSPSPAVADLVLVRLELTGDRGLARMTLLLRDQTKTDVEQLAIGATVYGVVT